MNSRNPLNLEVLETLDAIDRRGSFAKAAEELDKATSAVSYSVQKLEEQLGVTVFQRQGRRSVLTPTGQLLLEEGRQLLNAANNLANKARELATGWEPRIRVALDSMQDFPALMRIFASFLEEHPGVELDVCETVLNGGWEALEHDRIDLLVGSPGPVPTHKGFRVISLGSNQLIPVIAAHHPLAKQTSDATTLESTLPKLRRVITHDSSISGIARSAGLAEEGTSFYVQNMDQKTCAILAGIGIGHLPYPRIRQYIDNGELVPLPLKNNDPEYFLAWKLNYKGKGLQRLVNMLTETLW